MVEATRQTGEPEEGWRVPPSCTPRNQSIKRGAKAEHIDQDHHKLEAKQHELLSIWLSISNRSRLTKEANTPAHRNHNFAS